MAITVTPDLSTINLCESITGWTGGGVTDPTMMIQGSYCLADQVKSTTSAAHYYTGSWDMTDKLIYIWMACNGLTDTKANGGFRIYVSDGANTGYWYVGGGVESMGWNCYVIDPSTSPTTGSSVTVASITQVGVQFKTLTTVVGQADNVFWDAMRYGTGLTITSGATDGITFDDILIDDSDNANAYGVVQKRFGVYIVQGKLIFGDSAGTGDIDFDDTLQVVIYPENEFAAGYYGLDVVGNGTGTTNFVLGAKSGAAGISGCVVKANGASYFDVDMTDTDIDILKIYGTTFVNAGTVDLPPTATDRELINCSFEACGEITTDTCIITACNFISPTDRGITISSTSFNVTDSNFINCPDAINIDTAGTYSFDNLIFSNCTYDVENSSAGVVLVQNLNGSDASTYENTGGGSTSIVTTYTLTITVQDADTDPIQTVQTAIYVLSNRDELMNEDTDVSGEAEETYSGTVPVDVEIRCRKASSGATKYVNFSTLAQIGGNFSLLVTLQEDTNNNATT